MFNNYLLTALRHFLNNPLSSLINLIGLSVGLACFILISLYIDHETSYDKHYAQTDNIYRLDFIKEKDTLAFGPYIMLPNLKEAFPQIRDYVRINQYRWTVTLKDRAFNEKLHLADSSLLSIFDFPLLAGDPATALSDPFSVILSEEKARKFFGRTDVLGEVVSIRGSDFKVTAILRDDNRPTTIPLEIILPDDALLTTNPGFADFFATTWFGASVRNYVVLEPGTDLDRFTRDVSQFVDARAKAQSPDRHYAIQPMALLDIHLHATSRGGLIPNGSIALVYAFAAIAVLILGLACINFMNLATAQATQRAKEVGVRKSLGAHQGQLIGQFIGESVIVALLALGLSLGLVAYLLPFFSELMGVPLDFAPADGPLLAKLLLLAIAVGIVAGSYPAFYLASFKPALVLKGNISRGSAGALLRKSLVILQFAIAAILIVATGVIYQQMQLARDLDLGYDRGNLVKIDRVGERFKTLRTQLRASPDIDYVVQSHVVPTESPRSPSLARLPGNDNGRINIVNNFVSYNFFKAFDIQLVAGRVFNRKYAQDRYHEDRVNPPNSRGNIVINTEMARQLGKTPEQMIGQTLLVGSVNAPERLMVVGVVESSYYTSIRAPLTPMAYYLFGRQLPRTTVKIKAGRTAAALRHIDATWRNIAPGVPISRSFIDDNYNAQYQSEEKQAAMLGVFAGLAIIITCLGLFGLASFTTARRIKEIGIRKVLGAGRWRICALITGEFSQLVVIANLLAWPIAYIVMRDWLSSYANRIALDPLLFLASALATLLVAWLTVGSLAVKAASGRPVNALRYE